MKKQLFTILASFAVLALTMPPPVEASPANHEITLADGINLSEYSPNVVTFKIVSMDFNCIDVTVMEPGTAIGVNYEVLLPSKPFLATPLEDERIRTQLVNCSMWQDNIFDFSNWNNKQYNLRC